LYGATLFIPIKNDLLLFNFIAKLPLKYFFVTILLFTIGIGCKPKQPKRTFLEKKLIETMSIYLHKTLNPGVTFDIESVNWVPEKAQKLFVCQFNMDIHYKDKDTTGIMMANISYDFEKITRTK
jgi:hypothetical protein